MATLTIDNPIARMRVEAEVARVFKPPASMKDREAVFFEQRNFRKTHRAMCKAFPEFFETRPNPVLSDADVVRIKEALSGIDPTDIDLVLAWWIATPHYQNAMRHADRS